MVNNLKLKVADIIFLLIFERGIRTLKDNAPYHLFLTEESPEVILRFKYSSDFQGDKNLPGKILFDTQPNWRLYYSNKKYIFQTRDRIMVLTPDFTFGEVYMAKNWSVFPFSYPLDEILMINLLGRKRGILVHACGIIDKGEGIIYCGTSEAGKTTLAHLFKVKKDVTVLSDDRIIIRKIDGRFWMYGTPWHGDAKVCSPEKAPLERIFFLNHARENKVKRVEGIDAASKLLVCSFSPFWDKKGMEFTLGFIDELTEKIPCYELGFLPDERIIDFVKSI